MSNRELTKIFKENSKILLNKYNCCQKCGRRIGLEVHHIKPVVCGGSDDINNLVVLCDICHNDEHKSDRGTLSHIGASACRLQTEDYLVGLNDIRIASVVFEAYSTAELFDILNKNIPIRGKYNTSKISRCVLWDSLFRQQDDKYDMNKIINKMFESDGWRFS